MYLFLCGLQFGSLKFVDILDMGEMGFADAGNVPTLQCKNSSNNLGTDQYLVKYSAEMNMWSRGFELFSVRRCLSETEQ